MIIFNKFITNYWLSQEHEDLKKKSGTSGDVGESPIVN